MVLNLPNTCLPRLSILKRQTASKQHYIPKSSKPGSTMQHCALSAHHNLSTTFYGKLPSPVSSKGFNCLRHHHTHSYQAQTPSTFTWRQIRLGMAITRLLHFSFFPCWNSQPVTPFVWPSLTFSHCSMGFIAPNSLLLQGTMWEAQQPAPCPWYTTAQIALPVSHQEM